MFSVKTAKFQIITIRSDNSSCESIGLVPQQSVEYMD